MSEREAFENTQRRLLSLPQDFNFAVDLDGDYVVTRMREDWNLFQQAVEHCKQGEPVCFADPDDVDMKTYPDLAFNFPVRTKQGGNFTQPLFTHAMPKSDGRCTSCNGNDSDAPCAYPSENKHGCLRDERIATPQASTDVSESELVVEVDKFIGMINDSTQISDINQQESVLRELIAKHAVK